MTIHNAKGLQFPIVFLPFAWRAQARTGMHAPKVLSFHDESGIACIDLGSRRFDDNMTAHLREVLQEELRLLYVGRDARGICRAPVLDRRGRCEFRHGRAQGGGARRAVAPGAGIARIDAGRGVVAGAGVALRWHRHRRCGRANVIAFYRSAESSRATPRSHAVARAAAIPVAAQFQQSGAIGAAHDARQRGGRRNRDRTRHRTRRACRGRSASRRRSVAARHRCLARPALRQCIARHPRGMRATRRCGRIVAICLRNIYPAVARRWRCARTDRPPGRSHPRRGPRRGIAPDRFAAHGDASTNSNSSCRSMQFRSTTCANAAVRTASTTRSRPRCLRRC